MAIVNKFGGESQIAGTSISYAVAASPNAGLYPLQVAVAATISVEAGSPESIIVNTTAGAATVALGGATAARDGETHTISAPAGATNALAVTSTSATGGTTLSLNLNAAQDWATVVCQNQTTPLGVEKWGWVVAASSVL